MPGYFISDLGDMIRTYISPVSEEESDITKIIIRDEFYYAICDGYLSEMGNELTEEEKNSFVYAGKFMIYMQALRFLSDFLLGDIYYLVNDTSSDRSNTAINEIDASKLLEKNKNLIRTRNQIELLKQLIKKEAILRERLR
jgi:hypothetical protein